MFDELSALRERIATLQAEAEIHQPNLRSPAEAEDQLMTAVARAVEIAHRDARMIGAQLGNGERLRLEPRDGEGVLPFLVMLLGEEAVLDGLRQSILPHVPKRLDAPARAKRLAEIRKELDNLERAEERLIVDSGEVFPRRADARPEIVLEIAL